MAEESSMKGEPPLAAPSSHFEEDLSATLNQLDLAAPSAPSSLPKPIPLVRSTSDKRQAVPNTFSHDISPSPERAPLARASVESSSSSHFPIVTPSDTHHLIKPVISPAPPSRRTCVILQEACTKHRYERNKDGGSIVERPERIRAVKTGLAAAWARLEARNVLHGGTRWEGSAGATAGTSAGGEGELEAMMMGLGIKDTPGKEVLGGPFDILYSTAVLPVDDPALQFIHPSPNLPPSTTATPLPSPPPAPATTRSNRTPSASPAKSTPAAPFSAPPPPPPFDTSLPWPQQLSSLCKNAGQAMLSPPYSEIPSHLPQGDLYLSEGSEEAIFGALGAVCEGVDRVVEGSRTPGIGYDRAFVAIRPPGHHCCEAAPMGFCFVNNVAVAAAHAYQQHNISRVVCLDIDLHHGNGTQDIAWRINQEANRAAKSLPKPATPHRDLQIFYGSLHDIYSYPCEDGDEAMVQAASLNLAGGHSQWISNVHLESFDQEAEFHERLYPKYRDALLGAAAKFCTTTATVGEEDLEADKTLVIVSAGFDASQHESAGMSRHHRNVPTSFYHRFIRDLARFANEHSSGKVLAVLEGGYSDRALSSGALATMVGLTESPRLLEKTFLVEDGDEMGWWSEVNLAKLEKACKPRRGKLVSPSVKPSASPTASPASTSISTNGVSAHDDEAWLARAVEIFSIIEAAEVASSVPKEKVQPQRWMKLRGRKVAGSEEVTPQGSPLKTATASARRGGEGQGLSAAGEAAEQAAEIDTNVAQVPPKLKFTFKSGGIN